MRANPTSRRLAWYAGGSVLLAVLFLIIGGLTLGLSPETTCALGWNNPWAVIGMLLSAVGAILSFVAYINEQRVTLRSGSSSSVAVLLLMLLAAVIGGFACTVIALGSLGLFCPWPGE